MGRSGIAWKTRPLYFIQLSTGVRWDHVPRFLVCNFHMCSDMATPGSLHRVTELPDPSDTPPPGEGRERKPGLKTWAWQSFPQGLRH